ncbi:MAG TPA: hypothetical protein VJS30_25935, partial [Paraburkholderia sp.]|nr:hypothetical protein [Paraburkholderia sp.]
MRDSPGNIDTGIATTTQLPVFYRFFSSRAVRAAHFAWHNRFTTQRLPQSLAVIQSPHIMAKTLYDKLWDTHVVHT